MPKVSWKDKFRNFKNKVTLMKKSCTAHKHSHALQSWICITGSIINQGNSSKMTFVAGFVKTNLKSLKT